MANLNGSSLSKEQDEFEQSEFVDLAYAGVLWGVMVFAFRVFRVISFFVFARISPT